MVRELRGHMKFQNSNRIGTFGKKSSVSRTMTYKDKVILFNASRFLMPEIPKGTKNWITRDYIRYIDQHGRWYPPSLSFKMVQSTQYSSQWLMELQIRFHPDIRSRFRILTCNPDWTIFRVKRKKCGFLIFLRVGVWIGCEYSDIQSGHFLVNSLYNMWAQYMVVALNTKKCGIHCE